MSERLYVALARDPETRDDIVFEVLAATPAQAEARVRKFYKGQGWGEPLSVVTQTFRANSSEKIIQIGHAHHEYVKLEEQIRQLCEKLLDAARWLEGEGQTSTFDELRAFVASFEIGARVMEEQDKLEEEAPR